MIRIVPGCKARSSNRRALALILIAALVSLVAAGCATGGPTTSSGAGAGRTVSEPGEWGISFLSVNLTAEEHMVDLRYEVTDPDKAWEILNPKTVAYLLQDRTGYVFEVPTTPKAGRLQATRAKPERDRVYFMLFATHGMVKSGDEVSLIVNDVRFDGLKVR